MSPKEFENEFKRLIAEFPNGFAGIERKRLISRAVGPLNAKWWAGVVDHIILTNNPRFDIDAAARSERIARVQLKNTREVCEAHEAFARNITESGLDDTLKVFKARSIWEAVENLKNSKSKKAE